MDPIAFLLKVLVDQVLKRLPDARDRTRLRVQDELLRQMVDRAKEVEGVVELFADVQRQRDDLLGEVIRLRVRVAELEAERDRRSPA